MFFNQPTALGSQAVKVYPSSTPCPPIRDSSGPVTPEGNTKKPFLNTKQPFLNTENTFPSWFSKQNVRRWNRNYKWSVFKLLKTERG